MKLSKIWINLMGLTSFRRFIIARIVISDLENVPSLLVGYDDDYRRPETFIEWYIHSLKGVWMTLRLITIYFCATTLVTLCLYNGSSDLMTITVILSGFNGCITFPIVIGIRDKLSRYNSRYVFHSTQGYVKAYGQE